GPPTPPAPPKAAWSLPPPALASDRSRRAISRGSMRMASVSAPPASSTPVATAHGAASTSRSWPAPARRGMNATGPRIAPKAAPRAHGAPHDEGGHGPPGDGHRRGDAGQRRPAGELRQDRSADRRLQLHHRPTERQAPREQHCVPPDRAAHVHAATAATAASA